MCQPVEGVLSFEYLAFLGSGACGKVLLVRRKCCKTGENRLFAMKIMKKSFVQQTNRVARVLMEQDILRRTSRSPNLVTLQYAFQTRNFLHLVIELCIGGTLHRLVKTQPGGVIDEEYVRFYAAEILLGLQQLHLLGYIHRDIKPENVLISIDGHVRIADFDLCASTALTASSKPLHTIKLVGTANYMSPNILVGDDQNSAIDFWSLGVLIYELLFGGNPFLYSPLAAATQGLPVEQTFSYVIPTQPPISRECRDIIERLLQIGDNRLGTKRGAEEIMLHPWFASIDFTALARTPPPFDPRVFLTSADDTRYFPNCIPKLSKRMLESPVLYEPLPADPFAAFVTVTQITHSQVDTPISSSLVGTGSLSGWMCVFGHRTLRRSWKDRWFVLEGTTLRHSRTPTSLVTWDLAVATAFDITPFNGKHSDLVLPPGTSTAHIFHLYLPDRPVHFICADVKQKELWMLAISEVIKAESNKSKQARFSLRQTTRDGVRSPQSERRSPFSLFGILT